MSTIKFDRNGNLVSTSASKSETAERKKVEDKLKAALSKFDTKYKKLAEKRKAADDVVAGLEDQIRDLQAKLEAAQDKAELAGNAVMDLIDDRAEDLTMLQEDLESMGGKMLLPDFLQREYGFLARSKKRKVGSGSGMLSNKVRRRGGAGPASRA